MARYKYSSDAVIYTMSSIRPHSSVDSVTAILEEHSPPPLPTPTHSSMDRLFEAHHKRKGQRLKWFNEDETRKIRLPTGEHKSTQLSFYGRYALCNIHNKKNRRDINTKDYFVVCDIFLCTKKRSGKSSCHSEWNLHRIWWQRVNTPRKRAGLSNL